MAWFFMTPIIYPISKIPDKYILLYFLNPMASLVTAYRYALLGEAVPGTITFYVSFIVILVIFIVGWVVFQRYQKYFADVL